MCHSATAPGGGRGTNQASSPGRAKTGHRFLWVLKLTPALLPCPVLSLQFSKQKPSPCKRPRDGILDSANSSSKPGSGGFQSVFLLTVVVGGGGFWASLNLQIPLQSSEPQLLPPEPETTDDVQMFSPASQGVHNHSCMLTT